MKARYNGRCKLSGQWFAAGAEIERFGTEYVLSSELDGRSLSDIDEIIAERIEAALAPFGDSVNGKGRPRKQVMKKEFDLVYSNLQSFRDGLYGIGHVLDNLRGCESAMLRYYNDLKKEGDL